MKRVKLFALLITIGILSSISPTPVAAREVTVTKPFKGVFYGTYESPIWADEVATNFISGVGIFTHLGRATFEGVLVSDWSGYSPDYRGASVTGEITIVAADGSELYVIIEGEQVEIWVDGEYTGLNELTATYTITGGTKRFDDATGSGYLYAIINTEELSFWGYVVGTITITHGG